MAIYDIIFIALIGFTALFGYQRGLARQIASIASIVIGYMVAVNFCTPFARAIPAEAPWNKFAAMGILFLATSLLVWSIYAQLSSSLKKMELKGFDHQAGAIFGGLKGLLLVCILTLFGVSLLGKQVHDAIHESKTGQIVVSTIHKLSDYLPLVPTELRAYLDPQFKKFEEQFGRSDNLERFQQAGDEQGTPTLFDIPRYQGQWNNLPNLPVFQETSTANHGNTQSNPSITEEIQNRTRSFFSEASEAAIKAAEDRAQQWLDEKMK